MEDDTQTDKDFKLMPDVEKFARDEDQGGPVFVPPLYLQRYLYVQQELQKHQVQSIRTTTNAQVIDFGSAECKISKFLIRIPSVEKIALVDIDGPLLESNKYIIQPQVSDYIKCRNNSLTVKIYEGSVTNLDEGICDYEAVSLVEIIEHLYPETLEAACEMIFGGLRPKIVVVTTPNADYNELFPNFTGFRHWDHKFEWMQQEFKDWADDLSAKFSYNVTFSGVGDPPIGSEHLGFCSQIAVFKLCHHGDKSLSSVPVTQTYKLIAESSYPYKKWTEASEMEALLMEVDYLIRQICRCNDFDTEYEDNVKCLVPLSYFIKFEKFKTKFNVDQLRTFLQNHGYRISSDGQSVIVPEDSESDISDRDLNDIEDDFNKSKLCGGSNIAQTVEQNMVYDSGTFNSNSFLEHEVEEWE